MERATDSGSESGRLSDLSIVIRKLMERVTDSESESESGRLSDLSIVMRNIAREQRGGTQVMKYGNIGHNALVILFICGIDLIVLVLQALTFIRAFSFTSS